MENPIDKDKVAEKPGLMEYPHTVGGAPIRPEDKGKIKTRALTAMREQTNKQLQQIQKQVELMMEQAKEIQRRVEVSEQIFLADIPSEPLVHHVYHLYEKDGKNKLMMISPDEWDCEKSGLKFVASVKLMADHTWEILNDEF